MRYPRLLFAMLLAILLLSSPHRAGALSMGADPGFSYVDVDNDGVYDPAEGDIGLLSWPPVDIDLLIDNDGHFDTSQSELNYIAPRCPASLVVTGYLPHANSSLSLRAGVNLTVHGPPLSTADAPNLSAPAISLQACRTVDLTDSTSSFVTQMTVQSGCNTLLDGAFLSGSDPLSTLSVNAGGSIYGRPSGLGRDTTIASGTLAGLCANGCIVLDTASILTYGANSKLSLSACGAINSRKSSYDALDGDVIVASRYSSVSMLGDSAEGRTLQVCSGCDTDLSGTRVVVSGDMSVQSGGDLYGNTFDTDWTAGSVTLRACGGADLSNSSVVATLTSIDLRTREDIYLDRVMWRARNRIGVTSTCGDVYARHSTFTVDATGQIAFYAGGGCIDVTGSTFIPPTAVTYGPPGVHVVGP